MAHIRIASPLSRMFFRPMMWDDDQLETPEMTMTEGIDVYEEDDKVVVKAAVPGIPADQVDVTFEDGVLRIRAKSEQSEEDKSKKKVVYRMDRVTNYDYTTTLPRAVEADSIEAKVQNGIVVVTAKIAEAAKPKRIEVTAK